MAWRESPSAALGGSVITPRFGGRRWPSGAAAALAAVLLLAGALGGCIDPGKQFDDFLARADRTPPELPDAGLTGTLVDITGDYLLNIALKPMGDVYLRLRLTFTSYTLAASGDEATVTGEFRFEDETLDAPPLASFQTTLDATGHMRIDVGDVRIEAARSPIPDTAVEAEIAFDLLVLDVQDVCGVISDPNSHVVAPITLDLAGTTFGGRRFGPAGEIPVDIPSECPAGGEGGGDVEADAGGDVEPGDGGGDAEPLQPPDVDLGTGSRADVTGRFWLSVAVAGSGLALQMLLDATYHEGTGSASLDGSLRSTMADPGDPALATFSQPVDDNGEFTVVIHDLQASSPLGTVAADIALRGIIRDADTICGAAAGTVFSPLQLDLDGTTFGAVRIAPDATTAPDNAINACP